MKRYLRRYLVAGLLVWVPLGITIWVLVWLLTTLDQTLLLVPESARPEAVVGFHIPGLGVVLFVAILLLTGVIAANFFGARLILFWESVLGRIPVVKSIYSSVKQVSDTLLSESGTAFRKALLVEYPYPGSWTIAFLTGTPAAEIAEDLPGDEIARPRARHDRGRGVEVHHLDGGRRAEGASRRRSPTDRRHGSPRCPKLTGGRTAPTARVAARDRALLPHPNSLLWPLMIRRRKT